MRTELPLFPLQSVLFPGGLLMLKIFEARYLDLIAGCLRESRPFGVVALREGTEVQRGGRRVALEDAGTCAELIEVDSEQAGILHVRCRGTGRFDLFETRQMPDGLWLGEIEPVPDDAALPPPDEMQRSVDGLRQTIAALDARGNTPFLPPYRFDDAGWVANRWCELLPIALSARHKLMRLPDPLVRLQLVDEYLDNQRTRS